MSDSSLNNDEASPPPPWPIVMAGSAGGIAVKTILAALPANSPAAAVIVQHRSPRPNDRLNEVLTQRTPWSVRVAEQGERIKAGQVYLVRPTNDHGPHDVVVHTRVTEPCISSS